MDTNDNREVETLIKMACEPATPDAQFRAILRNRLVACYARTQAVPSRAPLFWFSMAALAAAGAIAYGLWLPGTMHFA